MINKKYFGTDGIRGKIGTIPITPDFFIKLGWAIASSLSYSKFKKIVIGKDTRNSGKILQSGLISGISLAGFSSCLVGTITTPAIAYLTKIFKADAGIVISASHNSFEYNGIKIFSKNGVKLNFKKEIEIEKKIKQNIYFVNNFSKIIVKKKYQEAKNIYIEFCKKAFFLYKINFKNLKIVVDCANGASYNIFPNLLIELGAKVIKINCIPNGFNINDNCGTINVKNLRKKVLLEKANIGIALDGDGDRVILIDHLGNIINGDHILYIIAKIELNIFKKSEGGVVGTVISNMGLEIALKRIKIPFFRSQVGDNNIMKILNKKKWKIGGETSGHIILLDKQTTSDAIIVSLQILFYMMYFDSSLYQLSKELYLFPQNTIIIPINKKKNILKNPRFKKSISNLKKKLNNNERIILRKSGTEPIIRIIVEGEKKRVYKISFFIKKLLMKYKYL